MRASVITIGNSKGIRLPKTILQQSGITRYVDLSVRKGMIKIVPIADSAIDDFAHASEASFAKDWLRPEEDAAWAVYQSVK